MKFTMPENTSPKNIEKLHFSDSFGPSLKSVNQQLISIQTKNPWLRTEKKINKEKSSNKNRKIQQNIMKNQWATTELQLSVYFNKEIFMFAQTNI